MRFKILQSLLDIHNTSAEKCSFCSEFELSNKQMHVQKTITMFFLNWFKSYWMKTISPPLIMSYNLC